jgi:MFS family permease
MEGANIASPLLTASVQYILNVALTLPAIVYLDRFGRRPSMLIGSFLMMTFLFVVGALQKVYGVPNRPPLTNSTNSDISWIINNNKPVSKAIVAMTYLFVCTFATTWGPTSWTYPSEIFPTKIRAKAVSLATASNVRPHWRDIEMPANGLASGSGTVCLPLLCRLCSGICKPSTSSPSAQLTRFKQLEDVHDVRNI